MCPSSGEYRTYATPGVCHSETSGYFKITRLYIIKWCFFGATPSPPQWAMASSFTKFLDHTQWRTTVGRTPLDEGSARRRDVYLTTYNTHNRQTSMPSVGFEPTISAGKRPQTYALDRAATGTGIKWRYLQVIDKISFLMRFYQLSVSDTILWHRVL